MSAAPNAKKPRGPKAWCDPPSAFGKVDQYDRNGVLTKKVGRREWQRPSGQDPNELAQFRAAVMQNAIAVHVREFKNGEAIRRTGLAALDDRTRKQASTDRLKQPPCRRP